MRYWVVDSETTGIDHEAEVVEVAGFYCIDGVPQKHYHTLVKPTKPIPAVASAIHHITDADVVDAPAIADAMAPFFDEEFEYVIAHNASFDKRFMDFGNAPWLCTYKLAHKVIPDAPSYSNQVLRYHLGLPSPVIAGASFAHRALYDAEITSSLFAHILALSKTDDPWNAMHDISGRPILLKKVTFGKHAGKLWSEVDRSYLDFILNKSSGWDDNVKYTAQHYMHNR